MVEVLRLIVAHRVPEEAWRVTHHRLRVQREGHRERTERKGPHHPERQPVYEVVIMVDHNVDVVERHDERDNREHPRARQQVVRAVLHKEGPP